MSARNANLTDRLARLEERQREQQLKLEALGRAIDLGLEDAASGRTRTFETGEIRDYLRGLGRTAHSPRV